TAPGSGKIPGFPHERTGGSTFIRRRRPKGNQALPVAARRQSAEYTFRGAGPMRPEADSWQDDNCATMRILSSPAAMDGLRGALATAVTDNGRSCGASLCYLSRNKSS